MKQIVLIALIFLSISSVKGQQDIRTDSHNLTWNLDYNKALEISSKEKKPILLFFTGSDWCSACKLLEENYFSKKEFIKLSKEFVLFELDFPKEETAESVAFKEENSKLKEKLNVVAFPTIIILDTEENVIGRVIGYRSDKTSKIYSNLLKAILNTL